MLKHSNFFFYQVQTVVKPNVFPPRPRHLDDEIRTCYQIAELRKWLGEDTAVVEVFRFTEDEIEAVEGTLQAQVAAHNAHIVPHNLLQLALGLRDEHHLLVEHHALGIPVGNFRVDSR